MYAQFEKLGCNSLTESNAFLAFRFFLKRRAREKVNICFIQIRNTVDALCLDSSNVFILVMFASLIFCFMNDGTTWEVRQL